MLKDASGLRAMKCWGTLSDCVPHHCVRHPLGSSEPANNVQWCHQPFAAVGQTGHLAWPNHRVCSQSLEPGLSKYAACIGRTPIHTIDTVLFGTTLIGTTQAGPSPAHFRAPSRCRRGPDEEEVQDCGNSIQTALEDGFMDLASVPQAPEAREQQIAAIQSTPNQHHDQPPSERERSVNESTNEGALSLLPAILQHCLSNTAACKTAGRIRRHLVRVRCRRRTRRRPNTAACLRHCLRHFLQYCDTANRLPTSPAASTTKVASR